MTIPYSFTRTARSRKTAVIVVLFWVVLFAAWYWLDAALWIVAVLAVFTLPAIHDLAADPESGLDLSAHALSWYSGRRSASLDLSEVDHVRLDTRLDFSVRVSAVLQNGRRVRVPFESTPPHRAFEAALQAHGVKTQRHHFQLMQ